MAAAVLSPQNVPLPHQLGANQGTIPRSELGWLRPTTLDTPVAEMRRRLEEDDYIFLKGVIPREDVMKMRADYFKRWTETDLLDPSADPALGIYNPSEDPAAHRGIGGGDPSDEKEMKILIDCHSTPEYRAFIAHPSLRKMVRHIMGWDEEILLDRTMLRHNVPGGISTKVHYDKLFLRGGDAFFLTAWVPIGDVPFNAGGLIYLENSVPFGQAIEDDFNERAKDFPREEQISAYNVNMSENGTLGDYPEIFLNDHKHIAKKIGRDQKGYRWLIANYEAGDVVFHNPFSIHTSGRNEDPQRRIRLSTDLRFYNKRDFDEGNADTRWMKNWLPNDLL